MKKWLALIAYCSLAASPSGEKVIHGKCAFERTEKGLLIHQESTKAIIHWDDFSIHEKEVARFIQPSSGTVLNRVVTDTPSRILGRLEATGRVFLINQNGILIGPAGVIKTKGFAASTLHLADAEFLEGKTFRFTGDSSAKVVHQGTIETMENGVFLIARSVESSGTIAAPCVGLAGGTEVFLSEESNAPFLIRVKGEGTITHSGMIDAVKTELKAAGTNFYGLAVNHTGVVHATGACEREGRIYLEAEEGTVALSERALLQAAGGEISVRAKDVYIGSDVNISADALENGDGGKIVVWGDEAALFYGTMSVRGGKQSGDGGFIELSSPLSLIHEGKVDARAPCGRVGGFLIDPVDVIISTAATMAGVTPAPPFHPCPGCPISFNFAALASANIKNTDLQDALACCNVTIDAKASVVGGNGDITVSDPVSWSANSLTLKSRRTITITSTLTNTGSGTMTLQATGAAGGNYQGIILNGGSLTTTTGDIILTGQGGTAGATNAGIYSSAGGSITSLGMGTINLTGTGGNAGGNGNSGIDLSGVTIDSMGGPISLSGTGHTNSAVTTQNYGILLQSGTKVQAHNNATITFNGTGNISGALPSSDGIRIDGAMTQVSTENGLVTMIGVANGTGSLAAGIAIDNGAALSTSGSGKLDLTGTGNMPSTNFEGMYVRGASTITSSSSGDIQLAGTSFTSTSSGFGLEISGASMINSTGTGKIILQGNGSTNTSSNNTGVTISAAGTQINSVDGAISITGQGGGNGAANQNIGISVDLGPKISSTGLATITLMGTGGSGVNINYGVDVSSAGAEITSVNGEIKLIGQGGGTGMFNVGVNIAGGGKISSSPSASGSALITIEGTGSPTGSSDNWGVLVSGGVSGGGITSKNGTISITGNGGGMTTNSHGILCDNGPISSTVSAPIILIGTAGGTDGTGILTQVNSDITAVGAGAITWTGVFTGTGVGINLSAATDSIGGASSTGIITLNAETMNIVGTISGTGQLFVQPINAATSIGLGTGEAGTLSWSNTELGKILAGFSQVTFGQAAGTHAITTGNATFTNPTELRGQSITVDNAVTMGANNLTFTAESMSYTSTISGTGTFLMRPHSASTSIGIGTGETGSLSLNNTSIGNITGPFSSVIYGRSDGDHVINVGNTTFTNASTIRGKDITVDNPLMAGTKPVTFNIGLVSAGTFNLNSLVTTTGLVQATGNAFNDLFNINVAGQTMTINGGGSTNTLFDANSTWNITGANAGLVDGMITFSNIQNLTGGGNPDTFVLFNGGSISGLIDGGGGTNTIDYSNYTMMAISVDLQAGTATGINAFTNIQDFIGNASMVSSTIIAQNTSNTWNVTANNAGNINGTTTFSGFNNLTGGTASDDFIFSDGVVVSGLVNGGAGTNTLDLSAYTSAVIWTINAAGGGSINGMTAFSNIQNLIGGSNNDSFVVFNTGSLTGGINGSGGTNTLDYSNYTAGPVSVDLATGAATAITAFTNIQDFVGNVPTTSFTLIGQNMPNTWNITANDAGNINGMTTFTNFGNLTGGSADDAFILSDGVVLSGFVHGGGGVNTLDYSNYTMTAITVDLEAGTATAINTFNNLQNFIGNAPAASFTLIGQNMANTWSITSNNTGSVNGSTTFSSFGNLTGGSRRDEFFFADGVIVDGLINGGGGTNTLNLSAYTLSNTWNITADNAGNVNGMIVFASIQNLVGGSGADLFIFADQVRLSGSVDGGAPAAGNVLDYTAFTTPARVCFLTPTSGIASNLGTGFSKISEAIGNFVISCPVITAGPGAYLTQLTLSYLLTNYDRDDPFTRLQKRLGHYVDPRTINGFYRTVKDMGSLSVPNELKDVMLY